MNRADFMFELKTTIKLQIALGVVKLRREFIHLCFVHLSPPSCGASDNV